ncbi:hypothetical protein C8Q74DRAFT_1219434 [Fomes fomentarius]|nr:hypothetical protein C8Q74DRAFT_1219434 [Fomes fomentarius]
MSAANPIHPAEHGHDRITQKTSSLTLTPANAPISLPKTGKHSNEYSDRKFIVDLSLASADPADTKGAKQVELPGTDQWPVYTSDSQSVTSTPIHPPGLRDDTADSESEVEDQVKATEINITPTLDASEKTVKPLNDVLNDPLLDIDTSAFEEYNYSLSGLPTLDTFIPDDLLPDDLLVHDIDNLTHPQSSQASPHLPVRYVRILPKTPREKADAQNAFYGRDSNAHVRVAHLYLKRSNNLGTGNHSSVYRAPFRLRLDADSLEERTVSVAVKTAHNECGAHYMLNNEARMYTALPRSFMEDRRVLPEEAESPQPVDVVSLCEAGKSAKKTASDDNCGEVHASSDSDGESPSESDPEPALPSDAKSPTAVEAKVEAKVDVADADAKEQSEPHDQPDVFQPAVLPKFYGYYAALNADGTLRDDNHHACGENATCRVSWPTRLLLVEECGAPVNGNVPHSSNVSTEREFFTGLPGTTFCTSRQALDGPPELQSD